MTPRKTLFAAFTGLAVALANSNLADNISSELFRVAGVLDTKIAALEEPAKRLAATLKGVTPVFTASDTLAFAAFNFKIQTNENAKTPAFWNYFPELNHNEMVGFTNPQAKFQVVMLRDASDHPRVQARMDVTKELYKEWGVATTDFEVRGENLLEKMFYAISFGLWTTYYLALEYNIDPIPVEGVENFKKRLKEVLGS